jgi:lipopolysaccharide transport system permease protein
MNPHAPQPTSPAALGKSLWRNRQLILQMTQREALGRYKGSFMGLAWSFFTPLRMLAVYIRLLPTLARSLRSNHASGDVTLQIVTPDAA